MHFIQVWRRSLKTRVTMLALIVFLVTVWLLTWYAGQVLRADMRQLLGEAQRSTVNLVAAQINKEIASRLEAMNLVASDIRPEDLADPRSLQRQLEFRRVFGAMFSGGAFVTGTDGVVRASVPAALQRVGLNYSDRDYFKAAVIEGRSTVGRPVMARKIGAPVFVLAVPLRDRSGQIIGMLAAGVDLSKPTFMDRIAKQPYGESGAYHVVSRTYRQIIISSEQGHALDMLPPVGTNPMLDEFVDGYEGVTVLRDAQGEEVLTAVKGIPIANWYAAVSLPTAAVFAPVHRVQYRLAIVAGVLSLAAGALMWLLLRRELAPLQATAQALAYAREPGYMPRLPSGPHADEIGQVISGFNRLLSELAQHQQSLAESEERYRTAFQISPDALALSRLSDGLFLDVNDGYTRLAGWSREEMVGHSAPELGIWLYAEDRQLFKEALVTEGRLEALEIYLRTKSGQNVMVKISARRVLIGDEPCALSVIHDLTASNAAREQIQHLEHFDALTGLPNRRFLVERLDYAIASAVRHVQHGALFYVDLDDFKTLNDTQGHDEGDRMLKEVALRLRECVQPEDTVARLAGDEFAVLVEGLDADPGKAAAQAEDVAQAIHRAMAASFVIQRMEHRLGCSIGITLLGQSREPSMEPLKRADLALYQAKAVGRDQTHFFEPQMQTLINARAALQSDLHHAIERKQLRLYYQVQVDSNGRAHGVESLMRWPDASRGMVSPGEFIPLAESTGLIVPLGRWALETACAQLASWASDPACAHLTIAVNVSSRQFQQHDFVDQVLYALSLTGADPRRLKVELTESSLAADINDVAAKMNALRARGVGFSLDDFGTGFSSLSYLKRLPLDQLKIDQSFVRDILVDPNDFAIAQMIVALGNTLGLSVIAEGVETAAQRDALAGLGCHNYQGYFFGRPVPVEVLERELQLQDQEGSG